MNDKQKRVKYVETSEFPDSTHLEIVTYYSLGSGAGTRGFYLSVSPVTKGNGMVSTVLGSGIRTLVLSAKRFSAKMLDSAVLKSAERENEIIDALRKKHNVSQPEAV